MLSQQGLHGLVQSDRPFTVRSARIGPTSDRAFIADWSNLTVISQQGLHGMVQSDGVFFTDSGVPRTQKTKVNPPPLLFWSPEILLSKPGVGQNIAWHAAPADKTSTYLVSSFPIHSSSSLFSKSINSGMRFKP